MRRAIARGRIVPQSLSTDPRLGRLSLKAALLFPLMWINSDDQGRLSGDPDEIKYATCPNINDITKTDIPKLLNELKEQGFIKVYATSKTMATQMLDWWEEQRLQWAYPSRYPPQEGWMDHLRYHPTPKEIITENWPPTGLPSSLPSQLPKELPSKQQSEVSQTLPTEKERGKGKGNRRGRGILPSALGSRSPPSPATLNFFIEDFQKAWGRKPNTREAAQLRDLEKEISSAGGTPEQIHDAFKEAAFHNKLHISYVRA
ncbi:unnamed protein product, partial [marine sediment metagenome]